MLYDPGVLIFLLGSRKSTDTLTVEFVRPGAVGLALVPRSAGLEGDDVLVGDGIGGGVSHCSFRGRGSSGLGGICRLDEAGFKGGCERSS